MINLAPPMHLKPTYLNLLFVALLSLLSFDIQACNNLTVSFTNSLNKSCGTPRIVTMINTSTGSDTSKTTFTWKVDNVGVNQFYGKNKFSYLVTNPGTHRITLIATTDSGCVDSAFTTFTFSTTSPKIYDSTYGYVHNPYWQNCILSSNDPDTFGIHITIDDTAKSYKILWGDGASQSGGDLAPPARVYHKYTQLGAYTVKLITDNGTCKDTIQGIVINERQPVAGLIGPPTGTNFGCVPLTVKYKNFSQNISSTTVFDWDVGDTTYEFPASTFRDSFFHTYRDYRCNQTITLQASNACGVSIATWNPINASDEDSAVIDFANPHNCNLNTSFVFRNLSQDRYCTAPDLKRYYWDFGDGTNSGWMSTKTTQLHKYNTRGPYTIKLIDSNSCGADTAEFILMVDTLPTPDGYTADTIGCNPYTATFTEFCSANTTDAQWVFDDLQSGVLNKSRDSIATHTFDSAGVYDVVLVAKNLCGQRWKYFKVVVNKRVECSYTGLTNGCAPITQNLTNTSVSNYPSATYYWDFGDGTSSTLKTPPSKTYNTPGNYTVTLIANDSCGADTFTQTLIVYDLPVASYTIPTPGTCAGSTINFNNTSTNSAEYIWDYGDGSNPFSTTTNNASNTYNTAGTYYIGLIAKNSNACSDTLSDSLIIRPNPNVNFTQSLDSGCGPLGITFTNTTAHGGSYPIDSMSFNWSFGNGNTSNTTNPSNTFLAHPSVDTTYTVQLIGENAYNCLDTTNSTITVYPDPIASFTVDTSNGCSPLYVNYTNNSIPNDTGSINIMTFDWTFGNGNSSVNRNEFQEYSDSRTLDTTYTSTLIAISEHGCRDTATSNETVYPFPTSRFTMDSSSGCSPFLVNFTNQSSPNDTGSIHIMSFTWQFGNGDSTNVVHPNSNYIGAPSRDSNYIVSLLATSEHYCSTTFTDTVTMFPKPNVNFTPDRAAGCGPFNVQFADQSTHANEHTWWFGTNVDTSTLQNPSHTFYSRSLYDSLITVRHTVVSAKFCKGDTISKIVEVYGDPVSAFSVDEDTICFPDRKQMLNNSQGAISYHWTFGQSDTSIVFNPANYFTESRDPLSDTTHLVTLKAFSAEGCPDTSTLLLTVLPYPIADFSIDVNAGCSPVDVTFTNESFNFDTVFWSFGDGAFSRISDPVHRYTNTGISDTAFRASLTVKTLTCYDTLSVVIPVHRPTLAFYNYERNAPCDRGYFNFIDQSVNAEYSYWDFGDGSTGTQVNPTHLLSPSPWNDTSYLVKLVTRTRNGCTDSMERLIPLPQRLKIGIKDTSYVTCVPGVINFENRTQGAVNYFWDFGNGTGAVNRDAVATYRKPGIYNYKLTAYDPNGCSDSAKATGTITILHSPTANFLFDPPKNRMPNSTFNFTDISVTDAPLNYDWTFYDVDPIIGKSTLQNPSYSFADSGWFHVSLAIFNGSCSDTVYKTLRIEPPFPIPQFEADIDSGCAPLVVKFTNNSLHASKYRWQFGDGASSDEFEPTHIYRHGGSYNVTLFSSGPGGEERIVKNDFIRILPAPFTRFTLAPNVAYLPNANFYTRNETTNATDYVWTWHDQYGVELGSSIEFEPSIQMTDTGYFDITLTSYSKDGCADTLTRPQVIYVNPKGEIHIPNTFTPNDDLVNDGFKPVYLNIDPSSYHFELFNRWGERVFITNDPTQAWDGTFGGEPSPQGVYAWKISAQYLSGDIVLKEGIVHLIR